MLTMMGKLSKQFKSSTLDESLNYIVEMCRLTFSTITRSGWWLSTENENSIFFWTLDRFGSREWHEWSRNEEEVEKERKSRDQVSGIQTFARTVRLMKKHQNSIH